MAQITLNLKTPIKIIETDHYYLVIEDADGVQHFFHNGHTT